MQKVIGSKPVVSTEHMDCCCIREYIEESPGFYTTIMWRDGNIVDTTKLNLKSRVREEATTSSWERCVSYQRVVGTDR